LEGNAKENGKSLNQGLVQSYRGESQPNDYFAWRRSRKNGITCNRLKSDLDRAKT